MEFLVFMELIGAAAGLRLVQLHPKTVLSGPDQTDLPGPHLFGNPGLGQVFGFSRNSQLSGSSVEHRSGETRLVLEPNSSPDRYFTEHGTLGSVNTATAKSTARAVETLRECP
jgi:hypothetical protein